MSTHYRCLTVKKKSHSRVQTCQLLESTCKDRWCSTTTGWISDFKAATYIVRCLGWNTVLLMYFTQMSTSGPVMLLRWGAGKYVPPPQYSHSTCKQQPKRLYIELSQVTFVKLQALFIWFKQERLSKKEVLNLNSCEDNCIHVWHTCYSKFSWDTLYMKIRTISMKENTGEGKHSTLYTTEQENKKPQSLSHFKNQLYQ